VKAAKIVTAKTRKAAKVATIARLAILAKTRNLAPAKIATTVVPEKDSVVHNNIIAEAVLALLAAHLRLLPVLLPLPLLAAAADLAQVLDRVQENAESLVVENAAEEADLVMILLPAVVDLDLALLLRLLLRRQADANLHLRPHPAVDAVALIPALLFDATVKAEVVVTEADITEDTDTVITTTIMATITTTNTITIVEPRENLAHAKSTTETPPICVVPAKDVIVTAHLRANTRARPDIVITDVTIVVAQVTADVRTPRTRRTNAPPAQENITTDRNRAPDPVDPARLRDPDPVRLAAANPEAALARLATRRPARLARTVLPRALALKLSNTTTNADTANRVTVDTRRISTRRPRTRKSILALIPRRNAPKIATALAATQVKDRALRRKRVKNAADVALLVAAARLPEVHPARPALLAALPPAALLVTEEANPVARLIAPLPLLPNARARKTSATRNVTDVRTDTASVDCLLAFVLQSVTIAALAVLLAAEATRKALLQALALLIAPALATPIATATKIPAAVKVK
jgi:hypothetical protein